MHGPIILGISTGCILLILHLFAPVHLVQVAVWQTEQLPFKAFHDYFLHIDLIERSSKMPIMGISLRGVKRNGLKVQDESDRHSQL